MSPTKIVLFKPLPVRFFQLGFFLRQARPRQQKKNRQK